MATPAMRVPADVVAHRLDPPPAVEPATAPRLAHRFFKRPSRPHSDVQTLRSREPGRTRRTSIETMLAGLRLGSGPLELPQLSRRAAARLQRDPFVQRLERLNRA